ncbi:putative diphthine synthase [Triticum urartu]|uniref:diphthine methyl ester synthase n=1 Tax=Triticum urartu TaxID=4572 RepID=M7ZSR6_TRIUA|nr:putative diphthine synthase [Triticum urartu]
MLYIVGLGLGDERDITVRGLDAVRRCAKVYMEAYTSLLSLGLDPASLANLEKMYGKEITVADREMVEERADQMLSEAAEADVAFLVVGDPFGATTHTDLVVRAKNMGVEVKVIHNASVINAIGVCGLQLYRYGETISIPFFTETWRPDSFYEKIQNSRRLGLHTLCLLDIRVKEPTLESLCSRRSLVDAEVELHDRLVERVGEVGLLLGNGETVGDTFFSGRQSLLRCDELRIVLLATLKMRKELVVDDRSWDPTSSSP